LVVVNFQEVLYNNIQVEQEEIVVYDEVLIENNVVDGHMSNIIAIYRSYTERPSVIGDEELSILKESAKAIQTILERCTKKEEQNIVTCNHFLYFKSLLNR
jgi:hypothetical protein